MTDNTITITMDDVLGPDGLEGAWDAMVRRLADVAEGKLLHSDMGKSFHAACLEAIEEAVTTRIAAKIEERMAAPIQRTDNYGQPIGEPTTFDAMIGEAVTDAFNSKVDLYGKRIDPRSRGMFDKTLLEHALQRVALNGIEKAVLEEVKKVREDAKKAVAAEVAKAVARAVK